jgi:hypothetical protein
MFVSGRPRPTGLAGRHLFENCQVCRSAPSERLKAETLEILAWRSIKTGIKKIKHAKKKQGFFRPDNPIKVQPLPHSVYPVSDLIRNRTRFGIDSDSFPRGPRESESHKHDFAGIGLALLSPVLLTKIKIQLRDPTWFFPLAALPSAGHH